MHLKSVKELIPDNEKEPLQKPLISATLYVADKDAANPLEPFVLNHQQLLFIDMEGLTDSAFYQLINGSGELVMQGVVSGNGINEIDHVLAPGVYVIHLRWSGNQYSKRLFF